MNVRPIRRIVVALDASLNSRAALEEAARLAAGLDAELVGIFVLDLDLLRLSALPGVRETGLVSARQRVLDAAGMERALRRQAEAARQALEIAARQHRLKSSFVLGRGNVVGELIAAASRADLLAMGVIGQMGLTGRHFGSTTRQVRARARCSLLLLTSPRGLGERVVVVCSPSPDSDRGLELALALARQRGAELVVLPYGGRDVASQRAELADRVADAGVRVTVADTAPASFEALGLLVRAYGGGLLVLGQDCPLIVDHDDELDRLGCPVLLASAAAPDSSAVQPS